MKMKLYKAIAQEVMRYHNGQENAAAKLNKLADFLPYGSGFDNGTAILWDESTPNKIKLLVAFHHMNDNGFYTKWTHHEVVITPDLMHGFCLKIRGENYREIKEYIEDEVDNALEQTVVPTIDTYRKSRDDIE